MKSLQRMWVVALALLVLAATAAGAQESGKAAIAPAPATPKRPVVNTYHGVKVADDYQWLEKNDDPEVRAWVKAQNERSQAYLDALPVHAEIVAWLKALVKAAHPEYYGLRPSAGKLFALKYQPGKQQPYLVLLASANDLGSERAVMDPNVADPKGGTSIQFYVPSRDGKYVAVCLASGGSEAGDVHVYETASGKEVREAVPRVNFPTAGGSVAWNAEGTGFYYTRYPHEGERAAADMNFYQQIYFHKLGTPASQDSYVLGKEFPRIAETTLHATEDGSWLLAVVGNGDGGQYEHFLRDPEGKWKQLTHFEDGISAAAFGADGALYLLSRKEAPRGKLLRLKPGAELSQATVVVPESSGVMSGFEYTLAGMTPTYVATRDRLYVVYIAGGPQEIRIFDLAGKPEGTVPIEPVSSVSGIMALGDDILFRNESYLDPGARYVYDPQTKQTRATALRSTSPVSFADVEATRETALSKDGTQVPLTVIRKKGTKLDGSHPTILTGYGGFGISQTPYFDAGLRPWLDAGGVYAIANLRGGGEFGEAWHRAGMLQNKQHVFDDFLACAEHLIQAGYTNPQRLGIEGGSNGGLLMGAALTQRPDLFRAVVSVAGLYDMLRFETTQNGQFNVTEYGSVKDAGQFRALYAYSPLQNVRDHTSYPAVLLSVGENDLRVDPWHSRKFAARLQAATASDRPIFLLSFGNAGHGGIGAGEDLGITMQAYWMSFLFDQLGAQFQSKLPEEAERAAANPEDVKSIDAIVKAIYECISGPAGQKRDWQRFRSLYLPGARLVPTGRRVTGEVGTRVFTVDEYARNAEAYFEKNSFYESEVARQVNQYGHIAQVFSTYASRKAPGEAPFARGINGIDLVNDGQRWWVVTVFWENESAENPIPEKYLKP